MANQNISWYHRPRSQWFKGSVRQAGVSLIELMIGITVGLIILAGVVAIVAKTTFSGLENIRAVQLNQQIRGTMDIIRRDLQRAGYVEAWNPGAVDVDSGLDIAAINIFGTVTLGSCSSGVCTCILYSYDRNADGEQGIGSGTPGASQNTDNFELYGFRLNDNSNGDGGIEMRLGGSPSSCTSGTWQDLTDASVTVTALSFELDSADATIYAISDGDGDGVCDSAEVCYARRKINISISAELTSDSAVKVQISNEVKIKNDHYYTAS